MDIIGFNEQIGNPFINKFAKSVTQKAFNTAKAKGIMPVQAKGITAKILDKAKLNTALLKAKQTGKPVTVVTPNSIKKFTPKTALPFKGLMPKTATPFNLVPTASKSLTPALPASLPVETVKSEIKQMEQSLQSLPASKQAEAIFNLPPTPAIVQNLNPVQRSFLKTDLPYKIISKNNFGQPTTKFLKNTPLKFNIDIDQIQPSVDAGISDYYGK